MRTYSTTPALYPCLTPLEPAMTDKVDKPTEAEFVKGAFSSAPNSHNLAKGILAAAIWRLLRK